MHFELDACLVKYSYIFYTSIYNAGQNMLKLSYKQFYYVSFFKKKALHGIDLLSTGKAISKTLVSMKSRIRVAS